GDLFANPAHHLAHSGRFGIVSLFLDVEGSRHGIDEHKSKADAELLLKILIQCSQILDECLQTFRPIEVRDMLNPSDWDFPLDLQFLHGCCNTGTQHALAFSSYNDGTDALIHFVSEECFSACRANCNQDCDEGFTCA